jgi:hypothetical protein
MPLDMMFAIRQEFEAVVIGLTVDMVDMLISAQRATQMKFEHNAVLIHYFAINPPDDVSVILVSISSRNTTIP